MPHIHTEPGQVDMVVTGYVFKKDDGVSRVLLHRHKKFNMLLAFGGHIELNETPWAAIAHELEEESGYTLAELEVMQPGLRMPTMPEITMHPQPIFMNTHELTFPADHYHADTVYLFTAHDEPRNKPHDGESQSLGWFTRDEIVALGNDEIWDNTRETVIAIFDLFLDAWQPVAASTFLLTKQRRS